MHEAHPCTVCGAPVDAEHPGIMVEHHDPATGKRVEYFCAVHHPNPPTPEMVADADGTRVVVEPALGCRVRGIEPPCARCAEGRPGLCENLTEGPIEIGLQTGYCESTGGGWGEAVVAHPSQLHEVPESMPDEAAVLVEPFACCVHAALRAGAARDDCVLVFGAGTIGLLTIAAIRHFTPPRRLIAVAKHGHQRELARALEARGRRPEKSR